MIYLCHSYVIIFKKAIVDKQDLNNQNSIMMSFLMTISPVSKIVQTRVKDRAEPRLVPLLLLTTARTIYLLLMTTILFLG
jgi:sugar phosphate permease